MGIEFRFGVNINGKSFQNLIFKIRCTVFLILLLLMSINCFFLSKKAVACLCYQIMKENESRERAQCVSKRKYILCLP